MTMSSLFEVSMGYPFLSSRLFWFCLGRPLGKDAGDDHNTEHQNHVRITLMHVPNMFLTQSDCHASSNASSHSEGFRDSFCISPTFSVPGSGEPCVAVADCCRMRESFPTHCVVLPSVSLWPVAPKRTEQGPHAKQPTTPPPATETIFLCPAELPVGPMALANAHSQPQEPVSHTHTERNANQT